MSALGSCAAIVTPAIFKALGLETKGTATQSK
jgi:hypothetical protein